MKKQSEKAKKITKEEKLSDLSSTKEPGTKQGIS
jgi:hypothetical protein